LCLKKFFSCFFVFQPQTSVKNFSRVFLCSNPKQALKKFISCFFVFQPQIAG